MDNNQHPLKSNSNINLARDYQEDNIPGDWEGLMNKQSDPNLERLFPDDNKKRTLYIYEIQNLFNNQGKKPLKFSPNTVKIGFIDVDSVLKTFAVEVSDFTTTLNQRNSSNVNDNTALFELTDNKVLMFQHISLLDQYKVYAISINNPVIEDNIDNLYIINTYTQPYKNPRLRITKKVVITKIKDFTANDGYPIIIKLQKPLASDEKVKDITLRFPKTTLFGNIRAIGEIDGIKVTPNLSITGNKQLFPLYALPIQTKPKVNILQQWFSDQVLAWDIAKKFITKKSVLDILDIGDIIPNPPSEEFLNVKKIELKGLDSISANGFGTAEKHIDIVSFSKEEDSSYLFGYSAYTTPVPGLKESKNWAYESEGTTFNVQWKIKNLNSVVLTYDNIHPTTTLGKVLIDILGDTFTYKTNFKGYDPQYDSKQDLTPDITVCRNEFENQKPNDVVTHKFDQWKIDNPDFVNHPTIKIFKQVVMMLSDYIISNLSINVGLDDDYKILLPYYFELTSKPTRKNTHDRWSFENVEVVLKSEYFDFTDPDNIKIKNSNITQNQWFKLSDNQYNWLEITDTLEDNSIPSLLPKDMSLANGEYGKYFVKTVTNDVNALLKLFNSNLQYFSRWDWFNTTQKPEFSNEANFVLEKAINNFNRLEISGIFASGKYDVIIKTDKDTTIELNNINLFNNNNDSLSYINIEL